MNKNCDYSANFQIFCNFLFYMGPHYVDFAFAFDTTLIRLEMTEIWPKYVAKAFLPPSLNRQLRIGLTRAATLTGPPAFCTNEHTLNKSFHSQHWASYTEIMRQTLDSKPPNCSKRIWTVVFHNCFASNKMSVVFFVQHYPWHCGGCWKSCWKYLCGPLGPPTNPHSPTRGSNSQFWNTREGLSSS